MQPTFEQWVVWLEGKLKNIREMILLGRQREAEETLGIVLAMMVNRELKQKPIVKTQNLT
jgi:hypothetical protein